MFRPLPALLLGVATSGALAGCHRQPAEVTPVQRFLQPVDPGQTRWELAPGSGVARGNVEEIAPSSMRGDRRPAITVRTPATLRFAVSVPASGVFSFAVAARPVGGDYTVRAAVLAPARTAVLEHTSRAEKAWRDLRVDLARWAGRTVQVELAVEERALDLSIAVPQVLGPSPARHPSVIVYVIDCLRADHVGAYGSRTGATPRIDALAGSGTVFERAFACGSWTKPAVGCLFTGLYPPSHGARGLDGRLSDEVPVLAEAFQRGGYTTLAWVANPVLDAAGFGYGRGFDSYTELAFKWKGRAVNDVPADAAEITDGALQWISTHPGQRFLMYLHSLDLHFPYQRRMPIPPPAIDGSERPVDLYDSEIAYNDRELGRLVDGLARQGIADDVVLVVTADHGEEFGEHGTDRHGHTLFNDLLAVPLVVRLPRGADAGRRVAVPVSQTDIPQTALDFAGLPALPAAAGRSLRPEIEGRSPERRAIFAEQLSPQGEMLYAVVRDPHKLIRQVLPEPREMLFDIRRDMAERNDLAGAAPDIVRELRGLLSPFVESAQWGYHLVASAPAEQATVHFTVNVEGGTVTEAVRLYSRTGDRLQVEPGRGGLTYRFTGRGASARHLVLRPDPPTAPLTLQLRVEKGPAMRAIAGDGSRLEPSRSGALRLDASTLPAQRGPAPGDPAPGTVRVTYRRALAASATAPIDPELREKMRALGYVQ
jgi:choline-sulfatase